MKEFYIYGKPIITNIGKLHFITVEEYYDFINDGHFSFLVLQKEDVINYIKKTIANDELGEFGELNDYTLFNFTEFAKSVNPDVYLGNSFFELFYHTYIGFKKLFEFCFKEDVFDKISSSEEFEQYRELILEINCIPYEKPNPNPEIERYNQMKRLMQKHKGDSVDFESMYTSVWVGLGECPDKLTLYRFNKLFARIAQFKNYDTTTLFATASPDTKIESWYKVIEERQEEKQYITEDQLKFGLQKKL